jgi:hypothetical protein
MLKRTVFLVTAAALALPALAAARTLEVQGPATVKGHGFLRGELQATDPSLQVRIRFRAGMVRLADLAGDLQVTCKGRPARSHHNRKGQAVYRCAGRVGRMLVTGSHYRLALASMRYVLELPEGVSGTLRGRFRSSAPTGDNGGGEYEAPPGTP